MPYTLGNLNTGADLLARGISGAGAGIGSGFKHWADNIRSDKLLEYYKTRDATDDTRQDKALNFQIQDTEARRKREEEEAGKLGTAIDLGAGYRGVLTGPRSLSVIAPEEKPFVPDADTLNTLQKNGYLYAPQSRHGGSIVPMKPNAGANSAPLGTTTDLGEGYRGVMTGPGRMTVVKQAAPKLSPIDEATRHGILRQLDDVYADIDKHQTLIGKGDNRFGFLNMYSRDAEVQELQKKKGDLEAKLTRLGKGSAAGSAAQPASPAAPAALAAPTTPAPATRPYLGAPARPVSPAPTPPLRPAPTAVQEINGGPLPANPTPAPAANVPSVLPQLPMTTGLAPQAPPAAPAAPAAPFDPVREIRNARKAISMKADPSKVAEMLRSKGIDPTILDEMSGT